MERVEGNKMDPHGMGVEMREFMRGLLQVEGPRHE